MADEPAFNWQVRQTLAKRSRIISKFKTEKTGHKIKFGIEVQSKVKEALRLDKEN